MFIVNVLIITGGESVVPYLYCVFAALRAVLGQCCCVEQSPRPKPTCN